MQPASLSLLTWRRHSQIRVYWGSKFCWTNCDLVPRGLKITKHKTALKELRLVKHCSRRSAWLALFPHRQSFIWPSLRNWANNKFVSWLLKVGLDRFLIAVSIPYGKCSVTISASFYFQHSCTRNMNDSALFLSHTPDILTSEYWWRKWFCSHKTSERVLFMPILDHCQIFFLKKNFSFHLIFFIVYEILDVEVF